MTQTRRRSMEAILLVMPALAAVMLVLLLPTLNSLRMSLTNFSLSRPGPFDFVGLQNYRAALRIGEFQRSIRNTFVFTAVGVMFQVSLGLVLALLLNRALKLRGLLRATILFPWALPTALNAIVWRWMYNADLGVFNFLLLQSGLVQQRINWLGASNLAMGSMIFVAVWKTSSFMALIILTGLQTIPDDLYEAAIIDGASPWQRFRRITFPFVAPAIVLSMLLRSMDAFRAFELPFTLTEGGPAGTTQTISLYGYRQLFQFLNFDRGSAVAVLQFLMLLVLGIVYIVILRKREKAL